MLDLNRGDKHRKARALTLTMAPAIHRFSSAPCLCSQAHGLLLKHSEEELTEARQKVARMSDEAAVLRGEVRRLQEEVQEKEEEMRRAGRQQERLSGHVSKMSQELEELRAKRQAAGSRRPAQHTQGLVHT